MSLIHNPPPKNEIIQLLNNSYSMRRIAKHYSTSIWVVQQWFDNLGIQHLPKHLIRPPYTYNRPKYSKEIIEKELEIYGSIIDAAENLKCSRNVLGRWMKYYGIAKPEQSISIQLNETFMEFFDGIMISDGYLNNQSRNSQFNFSTSFMEYVEGIAKVLEKNKIPNIINVYNENNFTKGFGAFGNSTGLRFDLRTTCIVELTHERKRWYPNGKKIVPKDLRDTPMMWHWFYIGDGSIRLTSKSKWSGVISLHTNAFTRNDCEYLSNLLNNRGIRSKVTYARYPGDNQNIIQIKDVHEFLDFIGPPQCDFFKYKWDINKRPSRLCKWCSKPIKVIQQNTWYCNWKCKRKHDNPLQTFNRKISVPPSLESRFDLLDREVQE